MHKLLKASIAGAAGIALLAGGAGTFALWQDSAEISVSQIQSGKLELAAPTAGVWKSGNTVISDIASYRIVPGETLTYTQDLAITATGNALKAELSYAQATATGGISGATSSLAVTGTNITAKSGTANTFTVTPNAATATTAKAVVTVTFAADGKTGQNQTTTLGAVTFTLKQVAS